jgi:DNA mismatch repair ATPase MutS
MQNLDVFEGTTSLTSVLDTTVTPFGSRLLRKWICFPFNAQSGTDNAKGLIERQDCVADLVAHPNELQ